MGTHHRPPRCLGGLYEERERRYDKFQRFIDAHYVKTDARYNSDLLEVENPGFDCYICCSDVIWKKEPNHGFDRGFFLASTAMEHAWKISYAASRGVFFAENEEDEREFLHYVEDIDAISVREQSLADYLHKNIPNDVTCVLDPVLLNDRALYEELLVKPQEKRYLFLYYVMERADTVVNQAVAYAKAHDLTIVEITERPLKHGKVPDDAGVRHVYNYDMGIEEWLGCIRYASCVFTNSFHCCCFSILFERQLFVGPRKGDKVSHLLKTFGLASRRFNASSDLIGDPPAAIDYEPVRQILEARRAESADFILSAIHRMEQRVPPIHDNEWWRRQLRYPVLYRSGYASETAQAMRVDGMEPFEQLADGSWEYRYGEEAVNDGFSRLDAYRFSQQGMESAGYHLRFKIDNRWFFCLSDGTIAPARTYDPATDAPKRLFFAGERLPYLPVTRISQMVAETVWVPVESQQEITLIYNGGSKASELTCAYDETAGAVERLKTGSLEYRLAKKVPNDGLDTAVPNAFAYPGHTFVGWVLRAKVSGRWYWLLADGTLVGTGSYVREEHGKRYLIKDGAFLPRIPSDFVEAVALGAIWKKEPVKKKEPEPAKHESWLRRLKRVVRRALS